MRGICTIEIKQVRLITEETRVHPPVDVLLRADGLCNSPLAVCTDVGPQGELHQNTIDSRVRVEPLHDFDDLLERRFLCKSDVLELDANLFCGLGLHANIHGGVGACTSLDNGQLGLKAGGLGLETPYALCDLRAHRPEQHKVRGILMSTVYFLGKRETMAYFARAVPSINFALAMA